MHNLSTIVQLADLSSKSALCLINWAITVAVLFELKILHTAQLINNRRQ
jgi:hypothetical protein